MVGLYRVQGAAGAAGVAGVAAWMMRARFMLGVTVPLQHTDNETGCAPRDMEDMENMENMALGGETHGRAGCRCGGGEINAHGTTLV